MKRIFNKIKRLYISQEKYIQYLKGMGVKIGENCEIYKDVLFGSEPYLVEIGNHVRITSGCKFVTHDGGVWVLRKLYGDERIDLFKNDFDYTKQMNFEDKKNYLQRKYSKK